MSDFDIAMELTKLIPETRKLNSNVVYWWMDVEDETGLITKHKVFGIKTQVELKIGIEGYCTPLIYSELVFPHDAVDGEHKNMEIVKRGIDRFFDCIKELEKV